MNAVTLIILIFDEFFMRDVEEIHEDRRVGILTPLDWLVSRDGGVGLLVRQNPQGLCVFRNKGHAIQVLSSVVRRLFLADRRHVSHDNRLCHPPV